MIKKAIVRVGLEVHCQLNFLDSKLFCGCSNKSEEVEVNVNSCPVCKGLPGSLPDLNGKAIEKGLILAKALNMKLVNELNFSRKHYFYPDLPKGFQITQTDGLIGTDGTLIVKKKSVPVKQIQLEEDPAKLIYIEDQYIIDYNRSGTPLIELVTEPVFSNEIEIKSFLRYYRRLLLALEVCDTKKEGAFRVDLNVSVGTHPRVEVKNIGSDIEIINAFKFEVERQSRIQNDYSNSMETRHWNAKLQITILSREKEEAVDYMYMPEYDIPKIQISEKDFDEILIPELPWETEERLISSYNLTSDELGILLDDQLLRRKYENLIQNFQEEIEIVSKFFWRDFVRWYNAKEKEFKEKIIKIEMRDLEILINQIKTDQISWNQFSKIIRQHVTKNRPLKVVTKSIGTEITNEFITTQLKKKYPKEWEESLVNPKLLNYLVGKGIGISKGQIKPRDLLQTLKDRKN
ncbi:MAG: Asp-tRNA(Asn)/Glu-tRNA(Gln) amidotransferase subunit GatB [Candidatus Hodarchaeales archaeon]